MNFEIGDCVILTKDYPFSGGRIIRKNTEGVINSDRSAIGGDFFYSVWFEEFNFSPIINEEDLDIC